MQYKKINKVVLIGAGNVATNLALAFNNKNIEIQHVYSKTIESAKKLGLLINTNYSNEINKIPETADLYIISILDDAIKTILKHINFENKLAVHTSGSVSIEIFKTHSKNYGVIYPLQTFSKNNTINFQEIPFLIEGESKETEDLLHGFISQISNNINHINSKQRLILHIAAVFSCNFTNHMHTIAEKILSDNDLDFNLLHPLIKETNEKILNFSPFISQTGPAIRNDNKIIEKHLFTLKNKKDIFEIYSKLSKHIKKSHQINE